MVVPSIKHSTINRIQTIPTSLGEVLIPRLQTLSAKHLKNDFGGNVGFMPFMTKVTSTLQFCSMKPITYVHIIPTQIEGHCAKITGCCTSNSADSESPVSEANGQRFRFKMELM